MPRDRIGCNSHLELPWFNFRPAAGRVFSGDALVGVDLEDVACMCHGCARHIDQVELVVAVAQVFRFPLKLMDIDARDLEVVYGQVALLWCVLECGLYYL